MHSTTSSKLQLLRARIESELKPPGVIMVTSAQSADGTTLVSFGLAECMSDVGRHTALVETQSDPRFGKQARIGTDPRKDLSIVGLASEDLSRGPSREAVRALVDQMRSRYDFTLIDAPAMFSSGLAAMLADAVDGVLLTVRIGRAPTEEDEAMVETLHHSSAKVLGVVSASAANMAEFERTRNARFGTSSRLALPEPEPDAVADARFAVSSKLLTLKRV